MSLQKATNDNTHGVRFMLEGNDTDAEKMFKSSLMTVRQFLSVGKSKEQDISTDSNGQVSHEAAHFFHSVVHLPEPSREQADGGAFVFQSVITLTISVERRIRNDVPLLNALSACSIFNAAILQHRLAMSGRHECLRKAEHMYQMCIKLIQGSGVWNGTAMTILVAAKNNLSQIQLQLGYFSDARISIQELSLLLGRAQHSGVRMLFPSHEWNGLIANTLLLEGTNVAPAA